MMKKVAKIVSGAVLIGLIVVLLVGAVIRTLDKLGNVAAAQGNGYGHGAGRTAGEASTTSDCCDAEANGEVGAIGRLGGSGGYGRSAEGGSLPAAQAVATGEWVTVEGTVVQEPAAGVDLVVETAQGEQVVVGTGPGYLETQGFALQKGEQVRVQGFWEDGEFKPGTITRLRDGVMIQTRDQYNRPAWSGGYGRGAGAGVGSEQAAGSAQGGFGGGGNVTPPGDETGTGQAQVDEWMTLDGIATAVSADEMTLQTDGGEAVLVDGRAWRFLQEQGMVINARDRLRLTGFYEAGEFQVGSLDNLTTGQSVSIRDESGRPLWTGRGRRGS